LSDFALGVCAIITVIAILAAFMFLSVVLGALLLCLFCFILAIEKPWKNLPKYGPPNIDPNKPKYPEEKE